MATILVIDDDEALLDIIKDMLDQYAVVTSTTAENILEQYQMVIPDVLVMDKNIPGSMTGEQALALLRHNNIQVPVLLYSADYDEHTPDSVQRWVGLLDGDDSISKPFDMQEFVRKVQALVEQGLHAH